MADLNLLREEIDKIDNEIVSLYQRRMKVCAEVANYKIDTGKKVFDKQREKEKISAVSEKVEGEFHKKGIRELYKQLMSMSRKLQYQMLTEKGVLGRLPFIGIDKLDIETSRIVYPGTKGAYTQAAMEKFFGKALAKPSLVW